MFLLLTFLFILLLLLLIIYYYYSSLVVPDLQSIKRKSTSTAPEMLNLFFLFFPCPKGHCPVHVCISTVNVLLVTCLALVSWSWHFFDIIYVPLPNFVSAQDFSRSFFFPFRKQIVCRFAFVLFILLLFYSLLVLCRGDQPINVSLYNLQQKENDALIIWH